MALVERLANLINRTPALTIAALSAGSCLVFLIISVYVFEVW